MHKVLIKEKFIIYNFILLYKNFILEHLLHYKKKKKRKRNRQFQARLNQNSTKI